MNRTYLLLLALAAIVVAGLLVSRAFRGTAGGDACPRPYPATELAALLAGGQEGWPAGVPAPRPDELRPLEDPADTESCRRLRALLPDTLSLGTLAASSVAFYQLGDAYVVPVMPNLKPEEIEAMEQGDFSAERHGATWVVDAGYEVLAVIPD